MHVALHQNCRLPSLQTPCFATKALASAIASRFSSSQRRCRASATTCRMSTPSRRASSSNCRSSTVAARLDPDLSLCTELPSTQSTDTLSNAASALSLLLAGEVRPSSHCPTAPGLTPSLDARSRWLKPVRSRACLIRCASARRWLSPRGGRVPIFTSELLAATREFHQDFSVRANIAPLSTAGNRIIRQDPAGRFRAGRFSGTR